MPKLARMFVHNGLTSEMNLRTIDDPDLKDSFFSTPSDTNLMYWPLHSISDPKNETNLDMLDVWGCVQYGSHSRGSKLKKKDLWKEKTENSIKVMNNHDLINNSAELSLCGVVVQYINCQLQHDGYSHELYTL